MEFGSLSIPYSEHCSGNYEVGTPEDDDAEPGVLRAGFIVECTAKDGTEPSRYTFDGLYDGERIAGTVSDSAADEVVADFLCTRLFTFWGTPKVKAVGEAAGDDVSAAPAASGRASAQQQLGSFTSSPMFQLEPPTQRAPSLSSDPLGAPAQHTRSHGASHPQPVRLPEARGALGLGCLDDGRASSHRVVVETRNELQAAPALPPGTHGLDLRDWLLLDEPSRVDQLAIKTRLLDDPILRQSVLQADDPVTLGAQMEALEMISSHVLWGGVATRGHTAVAMGRLGAWPSSLLTPSSAGRRRSRGISRLLTKPTALPLPPRRGPPSSGRRGLSRRILCSCGVPTLVATSTLASRRRSASRLATASACSPR